MERWSRQAARCSASPRITKWHTASGCSRWPGSRPGRKAAGLTAPNVAGAAFTLGILLFSGSLYWFGLTGLVPVEGSAPAGGFLLMFGWLAAMWTAIRHRR